ncbi:AAA family ATPase, partial [uncultured Prevotella sp.]|uniref:AAA family ATPase n=1 Tax=uncultured Prevotella sp. TaxID=159272 RepID=UPI0027E2BD4D
MICQFFFVYSHRNRKQPMSMARKLYPLGIQTFSEIRMNDNLYIDKTAYIYRMANSDGKFIFLS